MFRLFLVATAAALTACGSSDKKIARPIPQTTQRFDAATQTWVSVSTPTEAPTAAGGSYVKEEKSIEGAQVLSSTTAPPEPPPVAGESVEAEDPSLLNKVGSAATAPLKWVGLKKDDS